MITTEACTVCLKKGIVSFKMTYNYDFDSLMCLTCGTLLKTTRVGGMRC